MKPKLKMVERIRASGGDATHVVAHVADFEAATALLDRAGAFGDGG
jgi:hypothetical protein